jgi:hypothetical protein
MIWRQCGINVFRKFIGRWREQCGILHGAGLAWILGRHGQLSSNGHRAANSEGGSPLPGHGCIDAAAETHHKKGAPCSSNIGFAVHDKIITMPRSWFLARTTGRGVELEFTETTVDTVFRGVLGFLRAGKVADDRIGFLRHSRT